MDEDRDLSPEEIAALIDETMGEESEETTPAPEAPAPETQAAPPAPKPAAPSIYDDGDSDDLVKMLDAVETPPAPSRPSVYDGDDDSDIASIQQQFLEESGMHMEARVPPLSKPWMKHHKFVLVQSVEKVNEIVDAAIASGKCALDLETEGFDNRIRYDASGKPQTVHKIVGFCISYGDAKSGYYIPIRHRPDDGEPGLNVEPVEQVEAAISRLCHAAQPVLAPDEPDILSGRKWIEKPRVIIHFWNAKFDQEFLFPITGIDWWHPDSFHDGYLACYILYTDDKELGLKAKSAQKLRDPDGNPYEMIELKELFLNGRKIRFYLLSPDEIGTLNYACSDAVCTLLTCEHPEVLPKVYSKSEWAKSYRIEKQVTQVVRVTERNRLKVNRAKIKAMLDKNAIKLEECKERIADVAKANNFPDLDASSPKQLGEFLFEPKGLNIEPKPARHEKSGQYKTDADTLETMVKENPDIPEILKWVVEYRGYEKLQGTYLEGLYNNPDENDELRFDLKQTGTVTARFSAPAREVDQGFSGVPIQGIPKSGEFREIFEAREGYTMVKSDYAGQELRIIANLSGEPVWVNEFLHGSGDLHTITAKAFFNKERVTKEERAMGKCVHPDTLVFTDTGIKTLGSLGTFPSAEDTFAEGSWGTISDGTIRYDHNGRGRDLRLSVKALYNGGVKPLVYVVVSGGILTCTEEHRFKMRDGSLVRAGDLKKGDLLEQVRTPLVAKEFYPVLRVSLWEGIPESEYQPNHALAYFAGLYAGDGTGSASSVSLTHGASGKIDHYGDDYENWIQHLEASCQACGFTTTRRGVDSLYLGSRVFVRFLRALGIQRKRQKNLRMPPWVLAAGKEAILHYMGGLFDTDGTVGEGNHNLDVTTKDFVFAGQIATAMRACELDFHTELTFNKTYKRYYVRLRLTVESSWAMHPYLHHAGKIRRLRAPVSQGTTKDRFEVVKVLPAGECPCIDVTLDSNEHIYLANGFKTHNTSNFALAYGGGPAAIQRACGCDKMEAARRKQAFDKSVPVFAQWIAKQKKKVKEEKGVFNAFGRWIAIPDANVRGGQVTSHGKKVEEMEANKIRAACERHAINFPVQSSGADILKISMILLHKEFYKRGWLKTNGDDSVRIVLTVHDEVVFEVRHDRVPEVLEIIVDVMGKPAEMVSRPHHSPEWKIPLIVEPLIGLNWGAKYDYAMITKGAELKEAGKNPDIEVQIGDRVYHKIPPWLEPYMQIGHKATVSPLPTPAAPAPATPSDPAAPVPTPAPPAPVAPVAAPVASVAPTPRLTPIPPPDAPKKADKGIVTFRLKEMSRRTVRQMKGLCSEWSGGLATGQKRTLRLTSPSGEVLIDPSLGVVIDYQEVVRRLKDMYLTDGTVLLE